MTALLPPNLLRLFAPRPQPPFLKPLTKDESVRGPNKLTGCGVLVNRIREEAEEAELKEGLTDKPETKSERIGLNGSADQSSSRVTRSTRSKAQAGQDDQMDVDGEGGRDAVNGEEGEVHGDEGASGEKGKGKGKAKPQKQKRDKIAEAGIVGQEARKMRKEEREKRKKQYKEDLEKNYHPQDDPHADGDPYKTLFISRLSRKATEDDLQKEFEIYGAIEKIRIVRDRKGKSRNYAFIVYERERDMKAAYKDAEGIPIHHKKILVDVERGRTVKGWKPRKLGGGLGGRPKPVAPEAAPAFSGGGFRGRGIFRGGALSSGSYGGGRGFGGRGGGFGGRGGGGFRGGFGGDRGGFGGGRGGFQGGGGGFGGGGDRGYGGPPGSGGGGGGGYGPPGGGYGGRGGFQGGGGTGGRFDGPPGGGMGYGGPPPQSNGYGGGPPGGGYGGGGPGGPGGYGDYDRDAKRPRY